MTNNTNRPAVTVYTSAALGEASTPADVDGYAANLERLLSSRFGADVTVETSGRRLGAACPANDEINEYVIDLEAGDGWTDLLPDAEIAAT